MYRPLPDELTIAQSKIEGLGLFAVQELPAYTLLGITHIVDSDFEDGHIRTPLGGFYNHSDDPNCETFQATYKGNRVRYLVTIKDIHKGQELTCSYTLYTIQNG